MRCCDAWGRRPNRLHLGRLQVAVQEHLLPPFAGAVISLTNFDTCAKERLARLIECGGGRHLPELNKSCSHLVAASGTGSKFK